jgi:hypothetical protein
MIESREWPDMEACTRPTGAAGRRCARAEEKPARSASGARPSRKPLTCARQLASGAVARAARACCCAGVVDGRNGWSQRRGGGAAAGCFNLGVDEVDVHRAKVDGDGSVGDVEVDAHEPDGVEARALLEVLQTQWSAWSPGRGRPDMAQSDLSWIGELVQMRGDADNEPGRALLAAAADARVAAQVVAAPGVLGRRGAPGGPSSFTTSRRRSIRS